MSVPASLRLSDGSLPHVAQYGHRSLVYRAADGEYVCPECANDRHFKTPQKVPSLGTLRALGVDYSFILVEVCSVEDTFDHEGVETCAGCSKVIYEAELS